MLASKATISINEEVEAGDAIIPSLGKLRKYHSGSNRNVTSHFIVFSTVDRRTEMSKFFCFVFKNEHPINLISRLYYTKVSLVSVEKQGAFAG